jgi:hypothetical protein
MQMAQERGRKCYLLTTNPNQHPIPGWLIRRRRRVISSCESDTYVSTFNQECTCNTTLGIPCGAVWHSRFYGNNEPDDIPRNRHERRARKIKDKKLKIKKRNQPQYVYFLNNHGLQRFLQN